MLVSTAGGFTDLFFLTKAGEIMDFDINFTNVGIVMLDVLLIWACFSVDKHLKGMEDEEDMRLVIDTKPHSELEY